jgi:hypothetical protein
VAEGKIEKERWVFNEYETGATTEEDVILGAGPELCEKWDKICKDGSEVK